MHHRGSIPFGHPNNHIVGQWRNWQTHPSQKRKSVGSNPTWPTKPMCRRSPRGILKKCVNSQAVYPLSEQHGLKARERRYTAHEEGKHWE